MSNETQNETQNETTTTPATTTPAIFENNPFVRAINDLVAGANAIEFGTSFLHKHKAFLETLSDDVRIAAGYSINHVFFDYLTRAEVLATTKYFPGKWRKNTQGSSMIYRINIEGVHLILQTHDLPPSCKVVYDEIAYPAGVKKVAKIQCEHGAISDAE